MQRCLCLFSFFTWRKIIKKKKLPCLLKSSVATKNMSKVRSVQNQTSCLLIPRLAPNDQFFWPRSFLLCAGTQLISTAWSLFPPPTDMSCFVEVRFRPLISIYNIIYSRLYFVFNMHNFLLGFRNIHISRVNEFFFFFQWFKFMPCLSLSNFLQFLFIFTHSTHWS